ncbi:MAG: glycosyltransferase family 4 protein [Propionibacteriaceae bacterium]
MRVGLVCPYDLRAHGGVQAQVLGLARWLTENGHEAYVLAPGTLTAERLAEAQLPAARIATTGGSFAVPYNGSVARVACGPFSSRRVRRWLAQNNLDLLHVHEPITPSASVLALRATDLPIVATFHSATPGSRSMAAAGHLLAETVGRIDEGIAVSRVAADVVEKHLGLRPRVIGNGIRLRDFHVPEPTGRWRGGDRPRVTFVGRLRERRKGLAVLLDAVDDIVRQHPDVDICIAGAGVPIPAGRNVRYVGELTDSRRNDLLATSDVFVAPHTGRESFGIVLLEALASGAAVVASDLPAFVELLTDDSGWAGRVVETGSSKALADGISRTLEKPEAPSRGRSLAARYDWHMIGPKVVETYEDALGTGAAGRRTG